jgi:hypothetical protein
MSNKKFNARHGVSVGSTPVDVIDDTGAVLTNAATATKLLNSRTISISGDVVATGSFDGSGNLDLAATIQANSVALGTDTTGNYMVDVSAGTGVSVSHTQGEGSTATVSIGQAVATTDNVAFNNLTLAGELRGPATFIIDPSAVGDNTGKVVIKGDLQIDGTTTTINSTTLTVDDLVLTLGGDTAPSSDDTFDKGIEYRWFDTQARVGFFGFDRSTGKLTFIPQSSLSSGVYSGTTGEIDAKLDWSNVLNKPTIDNTTYNQLAVTTTGGALLRLNSSGGANDDVKFASGTNVTVAYTNDDTITISSSYIDTNTTYSVKASAQTNGAGIDLDAGGSGSGTDTVKILGSGGTTVTRTDADTITLSSTSVGDGILSIATKSAGATNTDVTLELSGAYSANTSTDRTIKAVVGPAITGLTTFMTTATAGFIRRTGQDTYGIDTNTYLTGNQSISLTGDTTGSGATSIATTTNYITASDDRVKAPSDDTAFKMRFGFTSWANNNTSPYADYLHLRSYTDSSGGNDNLVMFRKDAIGMRIWQQAQGSATAYSSYKDVAFTDQLPTVNDGTLAVSIGTAGATNTTVTWGTSTGFSANTASNSTYDLKVGPALTALATLMATAGPGFIRRTATADTFSVDTNTYLTSYTETDTLSSVTGRGASTSTNITLSGGTTSLGHATLNTLTASTGSLTIKTADSTTADSRTMFISTGNTSAAGFATGNLTIRTGSSTGLSGGYAGDILIWPGNSDGVPAQTTIRGGASVSGNTSPGARGDLNLNGGDNTSNVTSGNVTAGYIYILGGSVSNTSTNVTKYTGGVYISGGGSGAGGTINYGSINIGSLGQGTTYGTSAINIGISGIVTTLNGTIKLPNVGTSGFVKLGAEGQLSADTNTYAVSSHNHDGTYAPVSHVHSYLPLSGGTLTGDITYNNSGLGLQWTMNTDAAYIKFYNTGNGDTDSRLEYGTADDNNEYHRWMVSSNEKMNLKSDALNVTVGKISVGSTATYMTRNGTTGCLEFYV